MLFSPQIATEHTYFRQFRGGRVLSTHLLEVFLDYFSFPLYNTAGENPLFYSLFSNL